MASDIRKWNTFLMLKIPSAWLCGVRIKFLNNEQCTVTVRHRWINQNPFKSLYFAVQAMAAELSTGAQVMKHIRGSGKNFSMLVKSSNSSFSKKATGRIYFTSSDGPLITKAIEEALHSGEGQTFWMKSSGMNEEGIEVSNFSFEWTLKARENPSLDEGRMENNVIK